MLSEQGYENRLYVIEWHAELWRRHGTSPERCQRLVDHGVACLNADFDGEPRPPTTGDPYVDAMQSYLDRIFAQPPVVFPSGRVLSFA